MPRCLFFVKYCLLVITVMTSYSTQAQSSAQQIDRPEMAVSISPGFQFYSAGKGHTIGVEFPAFTMLYHRIMFSAVPRIGTGKAESAFKYNGKGFIAAGGRFTQEQLELQLGYSFRQKDGMIIPFLGVSGMKLGHKNSSGERKVLHLLPDYTLGVTGIYDLYSRFNMETNVLHDRIALRHFVRFRLAYTFIDPSTTGQPRTDLPTGMLSLGLGWGVFFSSPSR